MPKRLPEIEALRAQLNQARARELAALQLEQSEKLFKGSFIAQTRLDEARATYEREVARVREAEAQLKNALQPLGRDAEREAAEGEVDAAKAALAQAAWRLDRRASRRRWRAWCTRPSSSRASGCPPVGRSRLLPPGNVKARFYVPETSLSAVSVGRDIEIRCDGCPGPVEAR